jgi:hypothetical protein
MLEIICGQELIFILRGIIFILLIIIPVFILGVQDSIISRFISPSRILFDKIMGRFPVNSYDGDTTGMFGILIMWRFNRELRRDKETLEACRGIYNVYLSLIAAFVLISIFLIFSFAAC